MRSSASGRLGPIVAVVGTALFYKPDDYFDVGGGWRRQPGGGPILLNLTHEVNNLLSLVGDIVRVQAVTSNATRGFPVEDTAAMVFTFANGALGTFLLSDSAASARSWEQTSQENTSYSTYDDEDCYHIAGTTGSLSVPTMRVKVFPGTRSWWEPFDTTTEGRRPQRPAGQPGRPLRRGDPRRGGTDLQRARRPEDPAGGRRSDQGGPHRWHGGCRGRAAPRLRRLDRRANEWTARRANPATEPRSTDRQLRSARHPGAVTPNYDTGASGPSMRRGRSWRRTMTSRSDSDSPPQTP